MKATRLKEEIKLQYKSIMKFSEKIGVPYTTLMSAMESDNRLSVLSIQAFIKIAHGLGMTVDELIEKIK